MTHVEYADTMHAFLNFCGVLSAGRHAVELIATDLRQTCTTTDQNDLICAPQLVSAAGPLA